MKIRNELENFIAKPSPQSSERELYKYKSNIINNALSRDISNGIKTFFMKKSEVREKKRRNKKFTRKNKKL